ncbi:MAG: hypothetical protein D3922_02005, partial [Candidatus Electrothrix sp. AR1]|nr:hypothetical protein [Candidatus Electrothrix sp. AR1]
EGLLFFSPEMYKGLRLDEDALSQVDLFFCWGRIQRDTILRWFPEIEKKLLPCGNPRVDLMRKDYRDFYASSVQTLKKRYGKLLLVNTNFAFHNHFRSKQELRRMLDSYPLASEKGYIDGWVEYQRQGFETFGAIIPELTLKYPEYHIVIRPHPSEDFVPWQHLADRFPNVRVDGTGNVHEWIMASDVMLHDNCTTSVEAFILGVPPISYRKEKGDGRYVNSLPDELSYNVHTREELFETLDRAMRGDTALNDAIWSSDKQDIIRRYISGMEGRTSIQEMLHHIQNRMESVSESSRITNRLMRLLKKNWRKKLHKYREMRLPADGYEKQKFSGLTLDEISEVFTSLNITLGNKHCFDIRKIVDDVYAIRKCRE